MERNTSQQHEPSADEIDEQAQLAMRLMNELPDRQREVLHLHTCEGLDTQSIASVLGISPRAASSSLSIARKTVSEHWVRLTTAENAPSS